MRNEQLIPRRTPESRAATDRVQVVMELTSRLNVLRHSDLEARTALLSEILGRPMPETLTIYPPFDCDYGFNLEFGERIFVNQNCSFYWRDGGSRTHSASNVTPRTDRSACPVPPILHLVRLDSRKVGASSLNRLGPARLDMGADTQNVLHGNT